MPSFAARNTARAGAVLKAAAFACVLGLAGCGGDAPESQAAQPGAAGADPAGQVAVRTPSGAPASASDVAALAAAASSLDTTGWVLPPPFYAAGDEPFWRMDIVDGWFVFKRSGLPEIEEPMVQPKKVAGADVFEAGSLLVSIKVQACETDQGGHGDITAKVTFDGVDFDGCAFAGGGQPSASSTGTAAASDEAEAIVGGLTSIDACLAKLSEPAMVTAVYPREGDRTAVGLRAKDGSFYECATEAGGGEVAYLDPIEQGSQPSWFSRMRFVREGITSAKCDDAEVVRSGDKVLGRLLTKKCKF